MQHYPEANVGMFYIMKAKKIDKNNIYTYITKLR